MARKKARQSQPSSSATGTTAPAAPRTAPAPSTAITASSNGTPPKTPLVANGAAGQPPAKKTAERNWVDAIAIRASRLLGSLQVAVILLSLFTLAVLLGTLMEHYYSTKIAQELVYKAWWFVLLLGLLAVNIFFAAAKKWPWKWHQTGFVVTHIGLITMLTGGILNGVYGVDAITQVIDTNDLTVLKQANRRFGPSGQITDECNYVDIQKIKFAEVSANPHDMNGMDNPHRMSQPKTVSKFREEEIEPGALPWSAHKELEGRSDMLLSVMTWLRNPLGHSWSVSLDNNTNLEVIDYLPFTRREPYSLGKNGDLPAVKLQLRTAKRPVPEEFWLAMKEEPNYDFGNGAILEMVGVAPPELVEEFLRPLPPEQLGKKGVLVVFTPGMGGRSVLPVDAYQGKSFVLPDGTQVKITEILPNVRDAKDKTGQIIDPALKFEVIRQGITTEYQVFASRIGGLLDLTNNRPVGVGRGGAPLVWYHPPDVRKGRTDVIGLVQFLQTHEQSPRLFYRSFNNQEIGFSLETSGEAKVGRDMAIWQRMGFRLRVLEYLPQATKADRYVPVAITPGRETSEEKASYNPAIQCRLTGGKNTKEFWVGFGSRKTVGLNGRTFTVEYAPKTKKLGFEIKLERAEQQVDPGTGAPATYTSYVQLFDKEQGINGVRHEITMNQPLEHRNYKIYQSQYYFLGIYDANGRPVSLSGFTIGRDPGLELKYLGSILLATGIFLMFYMKAYFITGRRRAQPKPAPPPGLTSPPLPESILNPR